jgi:hypothetical protein
MQAYLKGINQQFKYYKQLGEKTIDQLSDDQLFWRPDPVNNSIAIIVKHLWGNMLSRWTDFLTSDGEKDWRERDAEFDNDIKYREELRAKWEDGWNCLFSTVDSLTEMDLDRIVYIRNQGHTVYEALNRQLAHYAYHVGQMASKGSLDKFIYSQG